MQGLLGPQVDVFVLEREPWTLEAREGLRDTFYDAEERITALVKANKAELYRVRDKHMQHCGWLILQRMGGMLFIWAYQGRGLVCLIHQLREYARRNGFEQLSFFTYKPAALRALRRFTPRILKTHTPKELQYVIECAPRKARKAA